MAVIKFKSEVCYCRLEFFRGGMETEFHCIVVAGLYLTEIHPPLPPWCWGLKVYIITPRRVKFVCVVLE